MPCSKATRGLTRDLPSPGVPERTYYVLRLSIALLHFEAHFNPSPPPPGRNYHFTCKIDYTLYTLLNDEQVNPRVAHGRPVPFVQPASLAQRSCRRQSVDRQEGKDDGGENGCCHDWRFNVHLHRVLVFRTTSACLLAGTCAASCTSRNPMNLAAGREGNSSNNVAQVAVVLLLVLVIGSSQEERNPWGCWPAVVENDRSTGTQEKIDTRVCRQSPSLRRLIPHRNPLPSPRSRKERMH